VSDHPDSSRRFSPAQRRLLIAGAAGALAAGAALYRRQAASKGESPAAGRAPRGEFQSSPSPALAALGWADGQRPPQLSVATPDGGSLAVWDVGTGPAVVLPHCWGCSHAVWIPVARRLLDAGYRVVLYDQRGHGASSRGTAPLSITMLADDLAAVLADRDVHDAVLAGHSMGGMTIMALATYHPEVLVARARALVLVATAAADLSAGSPAAERVAAGLMASPAVALALRSGAGRRFVRGVFGDRPDAAHMDLTRQLFADCLPPVRAGFLAAMSTMNLLEGIATIDLPTTVLVGTRDRLTSPSRASQMVDAIGGAHLITLPGRGHMLPFEDPEAVTDAIIRAAGAPDSQRLGA
jgi:pimeloyl-ACP methyl ester carboxylesterase